MKFFSKLFIFAIFVIIPHFASATVFESNVGSRIYSNTIYTSGGGGSPYYNNRAIKYTPSSTIVLGQFKTFHSGFDLNGDSNPQNITVWATVRNSSGTVIATSSVINALDLPAFVSPYNATTTFQFSGVTLNSGSDYYLTIQGTGGTNNYAYFAFSGSGSGSGLWSTVYNFSPTATVTYTSYGFLGELNGDLPLVDTTTRFDFTIPSATSTPTVATSTTIGAQVYINPTDYVDDMYLEMSFFNQTYFGASAPSVYETVYGDKFIKIPITASSTVLNLATSTVFTLLGDTNAVYRISRPTTWWEAIINFFTLSDTGYTTVLETKFKFTVSAKTSLDLLYDQNLATLTAFTTGTSTPVTNCGIATFNFADCAVSLIIPNAQTMKSDITNLRAMVLTHAPIGYVTRFVDILTSTSTAPLPIVTITFTPESPMAPYPTTFDMGDMFTGGASLLNSVTDPNTGKNAYEIFLPLVQAGVALAVLLTIISDILKIQGHSDRSKKYT